MFQAEVIIYKYNDFIEFIVLADAIFQQVQQIKDQINPIIQCKIYAALSSMVVQDYEENDLSQENALFIQYLLNLLENCICQLWSPICYC